MSEEVEIELALADSSYRISVVVRTDLDTWKRENVASLTIRGIVGRASLVRELHDGPFGESCVSLYQEPVTVFGAGEAEIRGAVERAIAHGVIFCTFTDDLFSDFANHDGREQCSDQPRGVPIAAMAFRSVRKTADNILIGLGTT
jgi:hypothetical protein